jgi:hypothetical protein
MAATPPTESAPAASTNEDERLGGARPIARSALRLPSGYVAEAIAAGFTAPCGVVQGEGRLYVLEAGHPRRTPPRLFRIEPESGAASMVAAFERPSDSPMPALSLMDGRPLVGHSGSSWFVGDDKGVIPVRPPSGIAAAPATFLPGSWLAEGDGWYVVDPGPPAADGAFAPGAGILWRIRAGEPAAPARGLPVRWLPSVRRELVVARPRPVVALGVGVAVAAIGLTLYYRARRGRPRSCAAPTAR